MRLLSGLPRTSPSCQRVGGVWEGAGRLLPPALEKAFLQTWGPTHTHTHAHGGCVHSEPQHQCSVLSAPQAAAAAARTHRQPLRSIRQTPMMRGCSSQAKLTQNRDRVGKRRHFDRFCGLARVKSVYLEQRTECRAARGRSSSRPRRKQESVCWRCRRDLYPT